ncbi:hypothetical protein AB6A40_000478 [Gnathostoma spinigerum]|uniref:Riboflavin transporter n=1 Tax=Gnathostoma spinigerum TaxID=75299 RepID=A0ABD6E267_9BILA
MSTSAAKRIASINTTQMLLKPCIQHAAVLAFGMGTWLSVNSLYVQLPYLVNFVPENWGIITYMVLIVQTACIAPLIYGIIDSVLEKNKLWSSIRVILIPIMLIISAGALLMSAFVYDTPTVVDSKQHSVLLFVAFLLMSIPCTTSDVLFCPFITRFASSKFVTTFFIGMGLSALVPSSVTLIQGTGYHFNSTSVSHWGPSGNGLLFGVRSFLVMMAALHILSFLGFLIIKTTTVDSSDLTLNISKDSRITFEFETDKMSAVDARNSQRSNPNDTMESDSSIVLPSISRFAWNLHLISSVILGAIQNGITPIILNKAIEPYGQQLYHLVNALCVLANPLACFLQFFIIFRRTPVFIIWTSACLILTIVGFVFALLPYRIEDLYFQPTISLVFVLASALLSWERAAIAQILRETTSSRGLFWWGAATQFGSFLGATVMFVLDNVFGIFPSRY